MGFVGIVELTLTPNAAIFSMHSTVNIPVKHMFMYFSAFLYASLCRWNCNAYTDKHTAERDRQTDVQAYELPRVPTTSHTVGIDASTTTAIPPFAVSRLSPCLPKKQRERRKTENRRKGKGSSRRSSDPSIDALTEHDLRTYVHIFCRKVEEESLNVLWKSTRSKFRALINLASSGLGYRDNDRRVAYRWTVPPV